MSLRPDHDLLSSLRQMREKIESDPTPRTPSLDQLYRLLVHRISRLESAQMPSQPRGARAC